MTRHTIQVLLSLLLLFSGLQLAEAEAGARPVLRVRPSAVKQGDPVSIRITGSMELPTGRFLGIPLRFSQCGEGCYQALAPVAQATKPKSYRLLITVGRHKLDAMVRVSPGNYGTVQLTLQDDKVDLSAEDEARADMEEIRVKALRQVVSEHAWEGRFIAPLINTISTPYGVKRIINGKKINFHKGIDLRGRMGDPVAASNSGVVVLAEELFFGGNTIILDHGDGIFTVYMHMSAFKAGLGQRVERGEVLGLVGSTGRSTGPHLHFSAIINSISVSPETFFKLPLEKAATQKSKAK